ncbi:WD40/YVTN/BNR-like repeat-containing protein [Hydrogenophaga sp. RWCD_12]|uniref:WD40/YVTN/BNR-like repeat-containing protein n=1 Tax=Hydrogenophaga sp. RWCD_12 TaxID=3391190 RepID=UPI003984D3DA
MTSVKVMVAALALAAGSVHSAAPGASVGDALQRPALMVRDPARAVLLSAAWAGTRMVAVGERGLVATSADQGKTWQQVPCPVSVTLTMVRFADAQHGVAVGHGGTVLTSADGGQSWTVRLDGRRLAEVARRGASSPQTVAEAERLAADGPDKPFLDVVVWDAQRMLAVGAYGLAMHTRDGGETWEPWMGRLPNPRGMHWYAVRRAGNTLLLAGEQGLLARSTDDGASFQALASPYKGSWFTAEMAANGQWLLAGLRGNVWRSTDGGQQWSAVNVPVPASIVASATDRTGRTLLASQAGLLLRLQGDAAVPLKGEPLPLPAGLLPHADGALTVLGMAGIAVLPATAVSGGQP